MRRAPWQEALVAIALFALASLSIRLTRAPGSISLFWPSCAVASAVLIRLPRVRWCTAALLLWLAIMLSATLVGHRPWQAAAAYAAVNFMEIALSVLVFRVLWHFPYPDIDISHASIMTAVFGVAIPAVSALAGGVVQMVEFGRPFGSGMQAWWSSHVLGACLFGPPIALFSGRGVRRLCRERFRATNVALLLLCVVASYLAIRWVRFPFVIISLILLLSAFRIGGFGTSVLALVSGLTVITLWRFGIRPLGLESTIAVTSLADLPVLALLMSVMPPIAVGIGVDARRATARALRTSDRHFREAMEHSPIGILIADLDGYWRHSNRALCVMLGYTTEELSAMPPGGPSAPDEWESSRVRWQRLLDGKIESYEIERRFRHKQGHWIWTHVAVSLMRDEFGAPLNLISQIESLEARRQAAQRLAEEHQRLITTLQSISDAVITSDTGLRVTYINAAAERLLGLRGSDAENRRVDELLHLTDPQSLRGATNLLARCLATGTVVTREGGCVLHRPDGAAVYVKDSVSPVLGPDGVLSGLVIVLRDASHEMDRELDLQRRATDDALTGLLGRSEFERRLRELFEKVRHTDRQAALLAIDLDRFKALNDAAGHAAGDAMLRRVADVCRLVVRAPDCAARLGGDEFVLLLQNCRPEAARTVGMHLVQALNPLELQWQGATYSVGASVGVAMFADTLTSEQQWLEAADAACYRAKAAGRGRMEVAAASASDAWEARSAD